MISACCRPLWLLASLSTGLVAAPAVAQTYPHPDSATVARAVDAGARLVHWIETTNGRSEHAVFLRNTSQEPIQITSFDIYDCVNLRGSVCGSHSPGPRLAPGKTVRLVVISRNLSQSAWSYKYRFHAAFVRDTVTADTSHR